MTVEPISAKQPCTPLKAAAATAGVAAAATAGLFAGHKADVFNKISNKIAGEGKVQSFAKKALGYLQKASEKISPKAHSALHIVKDAAKNVFGKLATVADKVIKFVSGSLDKIEAKVSPEKFAESASAIDEKLAEKFGNITTKF